MALPVPGAGRRGLVSFRLLGFPVTIHTSFVVIVLLLGLSTPSDFGGALLWLVIVTVSVLAHELGHALVAAPAGGEPRIDLYMLAGLTTWRPRNASRGRRVAVSVAGPAAGVVLGLALLLVYRAVEPAETTLLYEMLGAAVWVNLAWGLLNLLPMLPLDGGQVVLALMPGRDELVRITRASWVSLAAAAAAVFAALAAGRTFAAVLVVFFGAGNAQRLVALRRAGRYDPTADPIGPAKLALAHGDPDEALRLLPAPAEVPPASMEDAARIRSIALLRLGRAREALDVLLDLPPGAVNPVLEATLLLANGQDQLARDLLADALATDPQPWAVTELVRVLLARNEDVVAAVGGLTGYGAVGVLDALYQAGEYAAAAAWGERALATGATDHVVAYNTACSYARAGDAERALRALGYAAELGWPDVAMADQDEDLAPARALPEWPAVRARIAANPGLGMTYEPR